MHGIRTYGLSLLVVCLLMVTFSFSEVSAQPAGLGQITPPTQNQNTTPGETVGNILVFGIGGFVLIGALAALFYMLWGGLEWVTSEGNKEKIEKARQKITHAAIGMIVIIVVLSGYVLLMTDILGNKIIEYDYTTGTFIFNIPTIGP